MAAAIPAEIDTSEGILNKGAAFRIGPSEGSLIICMVYPYTSLTSEGILGWHRCPH